MTDAIRTEGTDDLQEIARALNAAGDRELTKAVRRSMREVAKPAGEIIVRAGAARMPKGGGFSGRVAGSKVGIGSDLASKNVRVTISLKNKGADLASLDRGILRHPVFPRTGYQKGSLGARAEAADKAVHQTRSRGSWIWRTQHVPAKTYSEALEAQAPIIRHQVIHAMQSTLTEAARKVH